MSMPRTALSSNNQPSLNGEDKLAVILYAEESVTPNDVLVLMERTDLSDLGSADLWKIPQTNFKGSLWPAEEARTFLQLRYGLEWQETELINVSRLPLRDDLPPAHAARKKFDYTNTYIVLMKLKTPLIRINRPNLAWWALRSQVLNYCQDFKRETYMQGLNAIPGQPPLK